MTTKRKRKFKLVRNVFIAVVISGSFFYLGHKNEASASTIKYSNREQIANVAFYNELEKLQTTNQIHFQNKELYEIVATKVDGTLNTENIKRIKSLTIEEPLNDTDLSDLKYLTDLRFLIINNNTIDLSDLTYNQNLNSLQIKNCIIYNSADLPNSISYLSIEQSKIPEGILTTPYNLSFLHLDYSPITKLDLKNPSFLKKLEVLYNSYFSLEDLRECSSLTTLELFRCPSLKDANVLTTLSSLKYLQLDEYASVWLDADTLEQLPIDSTTKEIISASIEIIDRIYEEINNPNLSEEEKINNILSYIIRNYKYDEAVRTKQGDFENIETLCNAQPIQSLNREEGIICINYACLFQALANRMGLEANEMENTIHAWNCVNMDNELHYYDPTILDSLDNQVILNALDNNNIEGLLYYDIDPNTLENNGYNTAQSPVLEYTIATDLGYYDNTGIEWEKIVYNPYTFQIYTEETRQKALSGLGITAIGIYLVKTLVQDFTQTIPKLPNTGLKKKKKKDIFD